MFTQAGRYGASLHASYDSLPITPADGSDVPTRAGQTCVGLVVTGAGNVNIDLLSGGTAVLTGLSAGQVVDVPLKRIRSTSTTATGISALYRTEGTGR